MKIKSLLLAVFFCFVLVSVARADGVATDKLVLSDGSSAVTAGLNEWFLAGSQAIAPAARWLVSVDIPNAFGRRLPQFRYADNRVGR